MIVSYSTITCPQWRLEQVLDAAVNYDFDAVEFRALKGTKDILHLPDFTVNASRTRKAAEDRGIILQALWTSIFIAQTSKHNTQNILDTAECYADAAAKIGAKQIRIFGGEPQSDIESIFSQCVEMLYKIGEIAARYSLEVMFETHDAWVNTNVVRNLISETGLNNVGVVWDIWATYHVGGEKIEQSLRNLQSHLLGTQFKDWRQGKFVLPGRGEIPLSRALNLLKEYDYNGPVTLEWEKLWHSELADAEQILPAFREYLNAHGI